jgi:hypothetical protein
VAAPAANLSRQTWYRVAGEGGPRSRLPVSAGRSSPRRTGVRPCFKTTGNLHGVLMRTILAAYSGGSSSQCAPVGPSSAWWSRVAPGGMAEGMTGRVPDPPLLSFGRGLSAGRHGHRPSTRRPSDYDLDVRRWTGRRESDLACSCGWRVGPDGSWRRHKDRLDDQGATDSKSDAKASNLARRQAQGMSAPVSTAGSSALLTHPGVSLELIEPARSAQPGRDGVAAPSSSSDRRRAPAKTFRSGRPSGSLWMPMLSWPA